MDLSDLNFDWEEDDDSETVRKQKTESKKPHKDASAKQNRSQTGYLLDEVEKKGNEEPIMTFEELTSGRKEASNEVSAQTSETCLGAEPRSTG